MQPQAQNKQKIDKQIARKFYIKGSGSSACLLTQKLDDQVQFIQLNHKLLTISQIKLSGLFAMCLSQKRTVENNNQISGLELAQTQEQCDKKLKSVQFEDTENQVYGWGNFDNQLVTEPRLMDIPNKQRILKISCGWNHSLFKTSNGNLLGFGQNNYGQLSSLYPNTWICKVVPIVNNYDIDVMCAGFRQTYWSTWNSGINQIFGCGQSKNYQIGTAAKKQLINLYKISYQNQEHCSSRVKKIACGKKFMIFLNQNNEIFGVGSNDYQSLVSKQKDKKYLQQLTKLGENIKDIECGWSHVLLLDLQGRVTSRGRNNFGQLGRATQNNQEYVQIQQKCMSISAGTQFSFCIGQSGTLYGWGWNQHMNIINQAQANIIQKPVLIKRPNNFKAIQCITYPAITIVKGVQIQNI